MCSLVFDRVTLALPSYSLSADELHGRFESGHVQGFQTVDIMGGIAISVLFLSSHHLPHQV